MAVTNADGKGTMIAEEDSGVSKSSLYGAMLAEMLTKSGVANGPITIAIRARFEYDSTTIRLQHATTRCEVFRALAYEIVYENQW